MEAQLKYGALHFERMGEEYFLDEGNFEALPMIESVWEDSDTGQFTLDLG